MKRPIPFSLAATLSGAIKTSCGSFVVEFHPDVEKNNKEKVALLEFRCQIADILAEANGR